MQGVLEILAVPYTHSGRARLGDRHGQADVAPRVHFARHPRGARQGRRAPLACGRRSDAASLCGEADRPGLERRRHIVRRGRQSRRGRAAEAVFGEKVLVEKFVPGRELTVAVMDDKAVTVTELRPPHALLRLRSQVHRRHHRASGACADSGRGLRASQAMGADGASGIGLQRPDARRPALGRFEARHVRPGCARAQHPARHDAAVAGARAGEVGGASRGPSS